MKPCLPVAAATLHSRSGRPLDFSVYHTPVSHLQSCSSCIERFIVSRCIADGHPGCLEPKLDGSGRCNFSSFGVRTHARDRQGVLAARTYHGMSSSSASARLPRLSNPHRLLPNAGHATKSDGKNLASASRDATHRHTLAPGEHAKTNTWPGDTKNTEGLLANPGGRRELKRRPGRLGQDLLKPG